MTFEFPLVLIALPVLALGVAWLEFRLPTRRLWRGARLLVRTTILALLLAALAQVHERSERTQDRRLVVLRDTAARLSAGARSEAAAAAEGAAIEASRLGIPSTLLNFDSGGPGSGPPDGGAGDLAALSASPAAALAAARLRFGPSETGGVLLISDGRDGLEGLAEAARALRADGLAVTAQAVPESVPPLVPQASILAFEAPAAVRGPFAVRSAVALPAGQGARLELRVDGQSREKRSLAAGDAGEVRFEDLDLAPGLHELSLTLEADGDAPASSPRLARRLVEVGAPPRAVACLTNAAASPWRQALGAQGLQIADAPAEALAGILTDAEALPDLLVADAASLRALPPAALHILMERIRQGLGLLLEAGPDREAWEALAERPLAELLPLVPVAEPKPPPPPTPTPQEPEPEIEPPKPDEGPGLKAERRPEQALPISLLLVIDCSPSMAGPKLEMALEGARRAALALSPWDRIGVISFANKARLDIRMRSARSSSSLELWLAGIEVRGEVTNIFASLKLASQVLAREKSPILHMILLTDGRQYPPGPLFGPVVKPMRRRGITITTIGIGRGARLDQLRDIVQWAAGGQVISAADASEIPTILTRDTTEVAEKRLAEAEKLEARLRDPDQKPEPAEPDEPPPPTRPAEQPPEVPDPRPAPVPVPEKPEGRLPLRRVRAHEALAGFEQVEWPSVGAPRLSQPAYGAAVLLEREDKRAVLAAGRAGLGRVLVWTLPPEDAGALAWPDLSRLFAQAGRAVMAPRGAFSFLPTARVVQGPDGATLHVDWPPGTSTGRLEVSWKAAGLVRPVGVFTPEDGETGRPLPQAPAGTLCRLEMSLPEGPALPPVSYLVAPPLAAPAAAGDAEALTRALASPLQPARAFLATLPTGQEPERTPRWPWAVWLATLLLPLDVWLHRRRQAA